MTKNKFQNFCLLKKKCLTKTKFSKKRKKKISLVLFLIFQWFSFGFADITKGHYLDRNQKNSSEIFFCENCEITEESFRLREIKNEILGKLGMTEEPKNIMRQRGVRKKELFYETNLFRGNEEHEIEENEEFVEEQEFISYAKIGKIDCRQLLNPKSAQSELLIFSGEIYKGSRLIEFTPQTALDDDNNMNYYQIQTAYLYVKISQNIGDDGNGKYELTEPSLTNLRIWIFQIFEDQVNHSNLKTFNCNYCFKFQSLNLISCQPIKSFAWHKFDITSVIINWYSNYSIMKQKNLRILIDCTGCSQRRLRHKQMKTFNNFDNQTKLNSFLSKKRKQKKILFQNSPFLVTAVKKNRKKMVGIRKRRHLKCSGETKAGECCLQPFYVSFRNLGWENWIVAPSGYFSNYCRGKCALENGSYRQSNYQRFFSNFDNNFEKCCAPVKFSKMSLIYYGDDGELVKRDLEKMVVEECACFF